MNKIVFLEHFGADNDCKILGTTCTFTAFVIEAVRVALENLEEDETDSK